jgi:hypothetical protein
MKVIAALVVMGVIGAATAGCGTGTTRVAPSPTIGGLHRADATVRPLNPDSAQEFARSIAARLASTDETAPDTQVRFRTIDAFAVITNSGLPGAYTVFVTVSRTTTVQPSSAASIETFDHSPPRFTSASDHALWRAAGSPSLAQAPAGGRILSLSPGQFSFIPQGTTMTYQQARFLPQSAGAFSAELVNHMRSYAGSDLPATLELKQLGYLIATAPLSSAARAAAWQVLASLPGLHLCTLGSNLSGRRGQGVCVDNREDEMEILVDKTTGSILEVQDRLLQPEPLYPMVLAGTIIESTTFVTQ